MKDELWAWQEFVIKKNYLKLILLFISSVSRRREILESSRGGRGRILILEIDG